MEDYERGSVAAILLSCMTVLGLSGVLIGRYTSASHNQVKEAEGQNSEIVAMDAKINAAARFKALVSTSYDSSSHTHLPALLASNYFDLQWKLIPNAAIHTLKASLREDGIVEVLTPDPSQIQPDDIASLFSADKPPTAGNALPISVEIVSTVFDEQGRLAESVVVKVSSPKGKGGLRSATRMQIPLQAPQPFNPILEIRREGSADFNRDFENIMPGNHELRVLGSGIVFDAVVKLNGMEIKRLGGFQGSAISHEAVNYLATDKEIGRFTFPFSGGSASGQGDASKCLYIETAGGSKEFAFSVMLYGPDQNLQSQETWQKASVLPGQAEALLSLDELYTKTCQAECPFNGPLKASAIVSSDEVYNEVLRNGNWSLYTNAILKDNLHKKFQLPAHKKACFSNDKLVAMYKAQHKGRMPLDVLELDAALVDVYAMDAGTCQKEFLFRRSGCGCFEETTSILLGDGRSTKPIHSLAYSDEVWNPVMQRPMKIRRISKGPEPFPMLRISTRAGSLSVTGKHPFPTPTGMKAAYDLLSGDAIQLAAGDWQIIESIDIEASPHTVPEVWNIEIEADNADKSGHYLVANGIITGDLFLQSQLEQAHPQEASENRFIYTDSLGDRYFGR